MGCGGNCLDQDGQDGRMDRIGLELENLLRAVMKEAFISHE